MLPTVRPATAFVIILAFFALAVMIITATVHNAMTVMNITMGF